MKHLHILTFCFSTLLTFSSWGISTFTGLSELSSDLVFAGVKVVEPGMEMKSHLVEIKLKDLSSRKISLPSEVENREVVGLFPAKDSLVVVTQNTRGGGDKPILHSFSTSLNTWKKIAEVDCISFAKVKVTANALEFSCEETSPKGEVKEVVKRIETKLSLKPQAVTLPVTKLQVDSIQVSLVEEDLDLTKLKVTKGKQEKVITP